MIKKKGVLILFVLFMLRPVSISPLHWTVLDSEQEVPIFQNTPPYFALSHLYVKEETSHQNNQEISYEDTFLLSFNIQASDLLFSESLNQTDMKVAEVELEPVDVVASEPIENEGESLQLVNAENLRPTEDGPSVLVGSTGENVYSFQGKWKPENHSEPRASLNEVLAGSAISQVQQDRTISKMETPIEVGLALNRNSRVGVQNAPEKVVRYSTAWFESRKAFNSKAGSKREVMANTGPITIGGHIEFTDGLVMTGEHLIDIRRYFEGTPLEPAKINTTDWSFKLDVPGTEGILVAKLINRYGLVEGESIENLSSLMERIGQNGNKSFKMVLRPVKPVTTGALLAGVSGNPLNKKPQDLEFGTLGFPIFGKLLDKGRFEIPGLTRGSDYILAAEAKGYPTNLIFANSSVQMPLVSQRSFQGFIDMSFDAGVFTDVEKEVGLVWGKITVQQGDLQKNSVPFDFVSGAGGYRVELEGESVPIYYGSLAPDFSARETSENGLFGFIVTEEGWKHFVVLGPDGKKYSGHVYVEFGKITHLNLNLSQTDEPLVVRSFDAFSGQTEPVKFWLPSLDAFDVDQGGEGVFESNPVLNMGFIDVPEGGDYMAGRYKIFQNRNYLHFPLIRKSWFIEFATQNRVNIMPGEFTHLVVFTKNWQEKIEILNLNAEAQMIYFDASGNPASGPSSGGGFVVYNWNLQSKQILMAAENGGAIEMRLLHPNKEYLSILSLSDLNE